MKNYWKFALELFFFLLAYTVVRLGFYFFPEEGPFGIEVMAVMVGTLAVVSLFILYISSLTEDNRVLLASFKMLVISAFGIILWKLTIDNGVSYQAIIFAGALLIFMSIALLVEFFSKSVNRNLWRKTLFAILIQTGVIVLFMWLSELLLPTFF